MSVPRTCTRCPESIGEWNRTGLCPRCYDRRYAELRRAGRKQRDTPPAPPCVRCGLAVKADAAVCRDCADVLDDLGEMERWAS